MENEIGIVKSVKNYLLTLEGLPHVQVNDILVSDKGSKVIVNSLGRDSLNALLLSPTHPQPNDIFKLDSKGITLPASPKLLGRVINPLGEPIDNKGPLPSQNHLKLEADVVALGIEYRQEITQQLETGLTVVDTLVPLGRGQRELIFGEPRSGKTTFLIDTLKTQHDLGVICIYTLLGKVGSEITEIMAELKKNEADTNTIVVAADVRVGAPLISIAPDTAFALADFFRAQGKDVLLILDDLGAHAKYLRELSLLSLTLPGREAYPGDIFYRHAHLMERAGNFNAKGGGGSITLLPIIETDLENFSSLIPTNLMASTDGHLLFESSLRAEGYFPAINIDDSVTRVGKQTQHPLLRQLSDRIRPILAEYRDLKDYGIFGTELGEKTQEGLRVGELTLELLQQEPNQHLPIPTQILLLSLLFTTYMRTQSAATVSVKKEKLLETLTQPDWQALATSKETDLEALIKKVELKSKGLGESF